MRRSHRTTRNPRTRPSTGSGRAGGFSSDSQRERRRRRKQRPRTAPNARNARTDPRLAQEYEVETVIGMEEYARREVRRRLGKAAFIEGGTSEGRFTLRYDGSIRRFDELRTVTAVHRVESFAVPRPRALLGHQHLTRLLGVIHFVLDAPSGRNIPHVPHHGGGCGVRRIFTSAAGDRGRHRTRTIR